MDMRVDDRKVDHGPFLATRRSRRLLLFCSAQSVSSSVDPVYLVIRGKRRQRVDVLQASANLFKQGRFKRLDPLQIFAAMQMSCSGRTLFLALVRPSKDHPHSTKSDREDDDNYYNCGCFFPVHVTSLSVLMAQTQVR